MNDLKKLKTDFLAYCEIEKNRSLYTVRNYNHYIGRFIDWAQENAHVTRPEQITLEVTRQYRLHLNRLTDEHDEPLKKITQNYHVIALRAFLKYLARRDIATLAPEKIELAATPRRSVEFLEPDELERLFASPKTGTMQGLRDRAVLELLFSTGLRVSELVGLDRDHVNTERGEFSVRGKGDKPRVIFISDTARFWVSKYLEKRSDTAPALFVRQDKARNHSSGAHEDNAEEHNLHRLTPRSIQRIVHDHATAAGIVKHVTPHTLRHSYATDLLINGADIRSVQEMLGHSSITTTQIYTHVTNQQLREVHNAFHNRRKHHGQKHGREQESEARQ